MNQLGRYQSGQLEQTVNLSSYDFEGSNPSLPTHLKLLSSSFSKMTILYKTSGSSSVGRATAFQAVGRGFEPRLPLNNH